MMGLFRVTFVYSSPQFNSEDVEDTLVMHEMKLDH